MILNTFGLHLGLCERFTIGTHRHMKETVVWMSWEISQGWESQGWDENKQKMLKYPSLLVLPVFIRISIPLPSQSLLNFILHISILFSCNLIFIFLLIIWSGKDQTSEKLWNSIETVLAIHLAEQQAISLINLCTVIQNPQESVWRGQLIQCMVRCCAYMLSSTSWNMHKNYNWT